MIIANRTENKLLRYFDADMEEVHPSTYLDSGIMLSRALVETPEDECGVKWLHVGWMPVDSLSLNQEDICKILDPIWSMLTDIPTDIDTTLQEKYILEDFYIWRAGTLVLDIWIWFDSKYPEGLSRHF